jgi:hypothetical protein
MSAMTDYTEQLLANWLLRPGESVTRPANLYLALHTTDPGESAPPAGETAYTGYARQAVTFNAPAAGTGVIENSNTVVFGANTGGGVTITHWAIFDSLSGGNCLAKGALNTSKTIDTSDVPSFPAGALRLTFA